MPMLAFQARILTIVSLLLLTVTAAAPEHAGAQGAVTSTTLPACAGDIDCPIGQSCFPPDCVDDVDNDGLPDTTDPCPADARNLCYGAVAVDSTALLPIRLNAIVSGSAECAGIKVDCNGQTWAPDFAFNLGSAAGTCNLGGGAEACVITGITEIFGCEDEETEDLFQCGH